MELEQSVLLIPDKAKLKALYLESRPSYDNALEKFLSITAACMTKSGLKPTLKGRVKEFDSYYSKKLRLLKKSWSEKTGPLPVNDILAIRIICPFLGDLAVAENTLSRNFLIEETERKGAERSFREFGYESIHILVRIPEALLILCPHLERNVVEIQLRTILQEAWAEVEHELVYKAEFTPLDEPMRRKLAAVNANLTLSDIMFQEILEFQKRLNAELGQRTQAFYRQIEEVSEGKLTSNEGGSDESANTSKPETGDENFGSFGLDGMMLAALEAHNKADFDKAVRIYGSIIAANPGKEIASVVYKHRGMAFFAQAKYAEAQADFGSCLDLDPGSYKALYYRGVVKSILNDVAGAVEDFTAALELHPYHFYSRYRRATCFFKMGDLANAHADCEIALRIEPENILARHLYAKIKTALAVSDF
ncbi:MAG: (p)ppGpp synthetase [Spirochaetes bacterium]|nr:(p)ppGpp synthetase [Spirochaetota bacterium]